MSDDCNVNGIPDEVESPWRYSLDVGQSAQSWGLATATGWVYINQFRVKPGAETVTHVGLAWSPFAAQGPPVKALIYDDPNQDGNPQDATLLASADAENFWTMDGSFELGFGVVPIGPVNVGLPGTSFFVGGFVSPAANSYVMLDDNGPVLGRSFVKGFPPGTENLQDPFDDSTDVTPFNVNWRIRALSMDCNSNSIGDLCDIASGMSMDRNADNVPDECGPICLGDIAPEVLGDNSVNIDDLLVIINSWDWTGTPGTIAADITGDGVVDIDDLLAVINDWGPCP
jgi:hypothetical protein